MALLNFDELIPKQADKLNFESLIPQQKKELDFNSLVPAQTRELGEKVNLPPIQGTPAPGVPLPPIPERTPPLPTPRPADLGQGAPVQDGSFLAALTGNAPAPKGQNLALMGAPAIDPNKPIDQQIPGAMELKKRIADANLFASTLKAPQRDAERAKMEQLVKEGKLPQAALDYYNKLHPTEAVETARQEAQKAGEDVAALPKTDFEKSWDKAETVSDMAKTIGGDIAGAVKTFGLKPAISHTPETLAALYGIPAAMMTWAFGSFMDNANKAIVDRGGDIDEPGKYQKVFNENKDEILKEAAEKAGIAGTAGAAMGALPGGSSLEAILSRLFIGYPTLNIGQRLVEREVSMVPVIGEDGKPVVGPDGKVQMRPEFREPGSRPILDTQPMSTKELVESGLIAPIMGAPFEFVGGREPAKPGARPAGEAPRGGEAPPANERPAAPKEPPRGPAGDESAVFASFAEDITKGRLTKEQVLDRIAGMSPDELAERARLTRQVGGKEFAPEPLSPEDAAYLQGKKAPAAQPSPEKPVEAPGEAAPVPPSEAPTYKMPLEEAAILKGAGYDIDMINEMSARERKTHLKEAKENQVQPAELTDEDKATLTVEKPAPVPSSEAPSARVEQLVEQGVPPLEAMKQAAEEPAAPTKAELAAQEEARRKEEIAKINEERRSLNEQIARNEEEIAKVSDLIPQAEDLIKTHEALISAPKEGATFAEAFNLKDQETYIRINEIKSNIEKAKKHIADLQENIDKAKKRLSEIGEEAPAAAPEKIAETAPAPVAPALTLAPAPAAKAKPEVAETTKFQPPMFNFQGVDYPAFKIAGRAVTYLDFNGVKQPYYLSTGRGGKKNVAKDKWYPFFGFGPEDGWFNKGTEDQINNHYGSKAIKDGADYLNKTLGPIDIDKLPLGLDFRGSHPEWKKSNSVDIGGIFDELSPVDHKNSAMLGQKNIEDHVARINEVTRKASEAAPPREVKFEPGLDPLELVSNKKLSADDIDQVIKSLSDKERETENQILGDKADEWRKSHRGLEMAANRADDAAMEKYNKRIAEIEDKLSEEDYGKLYGADRNQGINVDDWKDLRRRIADVEFADDSSLTQLSYELGKVSDSPLNEMNFNERATLAVIQRALEAAAENGKNPKDFLRNAYQLQFRRAGENISDKADVEFLVKNNMERLSKLINLPEEKPAAPQIAAPAPQKGIRETVKEAPALQNIKGHSYGSMNPKRFISMMNEAPSFRWDLKGKSPNEAGNGLIKVRVDQSAVPNGGKIENAVAAMPSAVKEVIVDSAIYGKLNQKQTADLNNALQKVENAGGKVTMVGEPPIIEKVKRKRSTNELGAYVAQLGGIRGTDILTGKPIAELAHIKERKLPGLWRKNGGLELWDAFKSVVHKFYPEYAGQFEETRDYSSSVQRDMLNQFVKDLESGGKYIGGKKVSEAKEEQALQDDQDRYAPYIKELDQAIKKSGIHKDDDIFHTAVMLLERGDAKDPYEAYEMATLDAIANDPSVAKSVIHDIVGDDYWSTLEQQRIPSEGEAIPAEYEPMEADRAYEAERPTTPEAGAVSKEAVKPAAKPTPEKPAEGAGKVIAEPVTPKPERKEVIAPEWLSDFAKKFNNGKVIYSKGNLAIVMGYSELTGEPIYSGVKRNNDGTISYTKKDVSNFDIKANDKKVFTDKEIIQLKKARDEFVAYDEEMNNANPNGPFGLERFAKSENIPQELLDLMKDWANMLGLEKRIYLTTPEDAGKQEFYGPFRRINSLSNLDYAMKQPLKGGDHVILLPISRRMSYNIEKLAHEMGHILENQAWKNATKEEKEAVLNDFQEWLKRTEPMNAGQIIKELRSHVSGKLVKFGPGAKELTSKEVPGYWRSFSEYFADQVARYMVSEPKPQSIVGKYFKRIADALKRLYESVAGLTGKSSKSMKEYLDARINRFDNVMDGYDTGEPDIRQSSKTTFSKKSIDEINEMNRKNGMEPPKEEPSTAPKETMRGKLARLFQDEFDYLRRIQEGIEKSAAAPLPESTDAYASVNLLPGRTSEKMADIQRDEVDPILDDLKKEGISGDEFGWFLVARHAKERNAMMAKRDPKRFGEDGGSGMANKTADEILKRYDNRRYVFERIAQKVYDMLDRDLDRRVEAGLMSEEEAKGYKDQYEYYVPLTGFAEMDAAEQERMQHNIGKGISVTKKESPVAMGRNSLANNPLLSSILKVQEGIYRAEKNRAAKALLALAKANPNPELWTVNKPKLHKEIGPDGMVKWVVDGMVDENTVIAKVGGVPYYITLKHPGLAEAYKKIGVVRMNPIVKMIGKLTRVFSQLQTTRNPDFMFPNAIRDVTQAISAANIKDPEIAKRIPLVLPEAFNIAQKAVRGKLNIKNLDKMSKDEINKLIEDGVATKEDIDHQLIYDEWRKHGGKISWNLPEGMAEQAKELQKLVGNLTPATWKYLPKRTLNRVNKIVKYLWDGLEKIGQPIEDMTRLSVYMAARDVPLLGKDKKPVLDADGNVVKKYTPQKASTFSQDFTINFYRKGQYGPTINALYAFSNAALQGDIYFGKLLFGSKAGLKQLAKFMAFFTAVSLWNFMISQDDEMEPGRNNYLNIPESEKTNNLIVKTGKGPKDYIRIPLFPIFSSLKDFSDNALAMGLGQRGVGDALANWVGNTIDAHNPVGSNSLYASIFPSIVRPFYDVHENKSYSGAPIHPKEEPWNKGIPHHEQSFASTSPTASMFTKFLYNMTNGAADIYPGDAEYITKSYLGGLGRTSGSIYGALNDLMQGKEVDLKNVPILRRFVPTGWDESGRYYELHEKFDAKINQDKKAGNYTRGDITASYVRRADKNLKDLRAQLVANREDNTINARQKQLREQAIKKDMSEVYINTGRVMVDYLKPPQ